MLGRELAEDLDGMFLDGSSLLFGVLGIVGDNGGREVGVVDRVVDRDRDFKAGVVVDHCAGYARPHRLKDRDSRWMGISKGRR